MAASGFTPIQLYRTATASAAPTAGNLADGELAINTNDGKLFYKDSSNAVQVIGWKTVPVSAGGTGLTSTPTNGQLDIGNGTGFTRATLTAGSGVSITNGSGSITIAATGSGGTVTSVSVVSANGLAGTVANSTTTPAITLSTSITGVLKGNGTAISAAVSGTDYAPATSGTSILYGNGSGGFSNVTIGTGLTFAAGTLTATATSSTSIGLVRAIAINCILP
jgi:hypothetical protein